MPTAISMDSGGTYTNGRRPYRRFKAANLLSLGGAAFPKYYRKISGAALKPSSMFNHLVSRCFECYGKPSQIHTARQHAKNFCSASDAQTVKRVLIFSERHSSCFLRFSGSRNNTDHQINHLDPPRLWAFQEIVRAPQWN